MNRRQLIDVVHREVSGERALRWATDLTRYYRSPGSSGYMQATEYVEGLFRPCGVDAVWTERYPLDGQTSLLGETVPLAWEPLEAELRLGSDQGERLMSYDMAPSCLPWWSPSTPPEGVTLGVVDVGIGERDEDYAGRDVRGKVALIRGTLRATGFTHAATLAMQRGAAGIVTDYLLYQELPTRTRTSLPDAVQLLRMPSSRNSAWAMSVDYPAAERLAALARQGEARVWANVQTRLFSGEGVNLLAEFAGAERPKETVLYVAHSTAGTKPGANCAAGPAMLVEVATVIASLLATGQVRRPRRTIRFLVVVEGHGSKHYLQTHRRELAGNVATMVFDSVGHDQRKTDSALLYYRAPDAFPSFVNDYVADLIETTPKEAPWVYATDRLIPFVSFTDMPYTPWSDNKYYPGLGVPAGLFMSWPDRYFHTQLLTADNLDPAVLHRCGTVAASAALELASAGPEEALSLMRLVAARSQLRLSRAAIALAGTEDPSRLRRRLAYTARRDQRAVASAARLAAGNNRRHKLEVAANERSLRREIRERLRVEQERLPAGKRPPVFQPGQVVPKRLMERSAPGLAGTGYLAQVQLAEEMAAREPRFNFHALRIVGDEMWNFTDGRRTVNEIAESIGFEFDFDLDPAHVLLLFEGLARSGYVSLEKKAPPL